MSKTIDYLLGQAKRPLTVAGTRGFSHSHTDTGIATQPFQCSTVQYSLDHSGASAICWILQFLFLIKEAVDRIQRGGN